MHEVRRSVREDPEVFGSARRDLSDVRWEGGEASVGTGVYVQGQRLLHHRLLAKGRDCGRREGRAGGEVRKVRGVREVGEVGEVRTVSEVRRVRQVRTDREVRRRERRIELQGFLV